MNNDIPNPKLVSYIRFNSKTNLQEAVAHVRETLKEIDPTFPFEISFYNTILNNLYQKEQTLGKLISLFGIMAILISIVGVFGLVHLRRNTAGKRSVSARSTERLPDRSFDVQQDLYPDRLRLLHHLDPNSMDGNTTVAREFRL